MKLQSNFALLDVMHGRKGLFKTVGGFSGNKTRVPVTITGYISNAWENDDGIGQGFEVNVQYVVCGEPENKP